MTDDNTKELRHALGQFATGVTIVTTANARTEPVGVTANSFSSVSLDPPMVLWSLAKSALSREAFESAEYFCVHVLTKAQRDLSELFALSGADKFRHVDWDRGPENIPMLRQFVARFLCRAHDKQPVGDHIVFVGEVHTYDKTSERPLVFHGGQYALAERRMMKKFAMHVGDEMQFPGERRKRRT